ncbi:hypothetical protein APS56_08160 [Pseudalgibacter alginicilyticus]|uniref:Uncharacterized protein n=1 Tax=Pseudalgibacter alginicilyticus TaxID=1736674 RepID=A0A0P0DAM7_9FLAO|nr:hypothetical protein [Pseudalgibacter alginicilyticus]ALJ05100.1 hypothetical protein APS56_08160 [Pseudalgibacter alginicilyticus]
MIKRNILFFFIVCTTLLQAQSFSKEIFEPKQDSIKKRLLLKSIGNGYFPTKYFNFDLRYLIKYNQYEGIRTGLGLITNDAFSEKYRINGYSVYGFRDHRFKYSIGGGFRLSSKTDTWLNVSYTDDLQETGSANFITDGRSFQFFEPRLLNIDLFHKHITKTIGIEHQLTPELQTETEFAVSKINPTYSYGYVLDHQVIQHFNLSTAKIAFQWSPFDDVQLTDTGLNETKEGFPKFTLQYTKSLKDVFGSDFAFSKLDFRTMYQIGTKNSHLSEIILVSGVANGNTPLSHLYHAYPNNITKETILQRFSVAGLNSFETMFFNEFFSDKFTTLQFKHFFKPFDVSLRYKPQLVLITRLAFGDMEQPEKHQNITFGTLNKGYTESGFEINKLLFGFGLSFTYRYGGYHLPEFSDNVAFKFTFNVSL